MEKMLKSHFPLVVSVTLTNNFATGFSITQYIISHAAAKDIPIAHPITPPKWAKMRKSKEVKIKLVNN